MGEMRLSTPLEPASASLRSGTGPALAARLQPRTRLILGIVLAAMAIFLLWWLFGSGTSRPHTPPPPPVIVAEATEKPVTVYEHTMGTVVANATVQVTARVQGEMVAAGFKEGDIDHKGQLLFQLDPRPFTAALAEARAALARDEAQRISAERDAKRYTALYAQGAISAQQRDQTVANAKALAASVAADKAAIETAQLNLDYAQIRAPIDGKTGPILVQPGNQVVANAANPLVVLTQVQPVKVSFHLPQDDLPRIQKRIGSPTFTATITAHGASAQSVSAVVDFVDNEVSDQTGTIELRATYPNKDNRLVPGQLVDVSLALEELPPSVVVPHDAVNIGPDGRYVYVVTADGKAEMRAVTVLYDDGTQAAVKGDVKAGDHVITEGQLRVLPGQPVTLHNGNRKAAASENESERRTKDGP